MSRSARSFLASSVRTVYATKRPSGLSCGSETSLIWNRSSTRKGRSAAESGRAQTMKAATSRSEWRGWDKGDLACWILKARNGTTGVGRGPGLDPRAGGMTIPGDAERTHALARGRPAAPARARARSGPGAGARAARRGRAGQPAGRAGPRRGRGRARGAAARGVVARRRRRDRDRARVVAPSRGGHRERRLRVGLRERGKGPGAAPAASGAQRAGARVGGAAAVLSLRLHAAGRADPGLGGRPGSPVPPL